MTLPFDHTHDLDLGTSVTMVGWADVPDSDRGDFQRRLAVDTSSYDLLQSSYNIWSYKDFLCLKLDSVF